MYLQNSHHIVLSNFELKLNCEELKDELKIEGSNVTALKANLEEERQNKDVVSYIEKETQIIFGVELEEKLANANIQVNECKHQNEKLKQELERVIY